jgi:hypothetical protein
MGEDIPQTHSVLPLPQQVEGFALSAVIVAVGEKVQCCAVVDLCRGKK